MWATCEAWDLRPARGSEPRMERKKAAHHSQGGPSVAPLGLTAPHFAFPRLAPWATASRPIRGSRASLH